MSSQEDFTTDSSITDSHTGNFPENTNLFEPKPQAKVIRVLTVLAYILSVSMAAILLSIYYIFMWDGRSHPAARRSYHIYNGINDSTGPSYSRLEQAETDLDVYYVGIPTNGSGLPKYSGLERFDTDVHSYEKTDSVNESDLTIFSKELVEEKLVYAPHDLVANSSVENGTDFREEMQQQITAFDNDVMTFPLGTTSEPTTATEENITFPDYEIFPSEGEREDLRTSAFMKRLMYFK